MESLRQNLLGLTRSGLSPRRPSWPEALYTVVDAPTAIATHINAIGREKASEPRGKTKPNNCWTRLPHVTQLSVICTTSSAFSCYASPVNLLAEGVPAKDMRNIIDALTAHAKDNQM